MPARMPTMLAMLMMLPDRWRTITGAAVAAPRPLGPPVLTATFPSSLIAFPRRASPAPRLWRLRPPQTSSRAQDHHLAEHVAPHEVRERLARFGEREHPVDDRPQPM